MFIKLPEHYSTRAQGHSIAVSLLSDSVVALRISGEQEFAPYASYAITKDDWKKSTVVTRLDANCEYLQVGQTVVEISKEQFGIRILRDGNVAFETAKSAFEASSDAPTVFVRARHENERVYGLGEMGENINRSGRVHEFWNTDDWRRHPLQLFYAQIPFALHMAEDGTALFGMFIDNPGRQFHDLGAVRPTEARYSADTGDLNIWLLFGDSLQHILALWTELVGRGNRPPLWALGYQQCRYSYYPESQVREIATQFRKRRIPCDVLYLDIHYMDDYRVFTWDSNRFPDPEKLIAVLRADGFRTVTIVDPGVKIDEEYDLYNTMNDQPEMFLRAKKKKPFIGEVWPGKVHYPDFTHPGTRKTWGDYQNEALLSKGVSGIWNDMNEPANFIGQKVPNDLIHHDFALHRTHEEVHQVYGHTMAQACCEAMLAARPDERPFVITRSGYAGVQRYAAVWTGDNESLWNNMPFDIQLNLSMGLTGISLVGCDIGGFSRDCTGELFARWIEWGVFQAFCRSHSAWETRDQEPWSFGPQVEEVARRMIGLRMELLPYLYTCLVRSTETGEPFNKPLFLRYPNDKNTHSISDQFLLGDNLLVAPILQQGMDRRMLYLPEGDWFDFWTDTRHQGGRWIIAKGPMGYPPLFVRGGAMIPMSPLRQHVGDGPADVLYLDVWPGNKIHGLLVEDDGITHEYRNGAEYRQKVNGEATAEGLVLRFDKPTGNFKSPRTHFTMRVHTGNRRVASLRVDGKEVSFNYDGTVVVFHLPDDRQGHEVTIDSEKESQP